MKSCVNKIVVVFKTHFDIGFTKLAAEVVAQYGKTMLPAVIETCEATKFNKNNRRYVWTMPAWPLLQSLDPNYTGAETIAKTEKLLHEGQIVWHLLPFTTHTEFCGLEEYIRGINFSRMFSEKYGRWPVSAKMTDVPGHTWILPSILYKAGVRFLHLGCNPGCTPPELPRLFYWEGPDGSRVLTFYNKGNYGSSLIPPADWDFPVWLALQQTGDNIGPQPPEIIDQLTEEVATELPGVEVIIGTLDDFYQALIRYQLDIPIVRADLADSWIQGVGTYPGEVGLLRSLRPILVDSEKALSLNAIGGIYDPEKVRQGRTNLAGAFEQSLLFGEHTWGLDVKSTLGNDRRYKKKLFLQDKSSSAYRRMEQSWDEQRERVLKAASVVADLGPAVLNSMAGAVGIEGPRLLIFNGLGWQRDGWVPLNGLETKFYTKQLVDTVTKKPLPLEKMPGGSQVFVNDLPALGYKTYQVVEQEKSINKARQLHCDSMAGILENRWFRIKIKAVEGVITSLYDKNTGWEWVNQETAGIGQYRYDVYGEQDITEFIRAYAYRFYDWLVNDLGRIGYPEQPHLIFTPRGFTVEDEVGEYHCTLILRTELSDVSVKEYGNAAVLITRITLYDNQPYIDLDFQLESKTETPFVEAGYFIFPLNLQHPQIRINKLGSVVDPATDIIKGANNLLYCCENWVDLSDGKQGLAVIPFDTPLFSLGNPAIYQYRQQYRVAEPTLYFNAFNNSWGTNFPQWMGGNYRFRYRLIPHPGDWKQGRISEQALESVAPPLVGFSTGKDLVENRLPVFEEFLKVSTGLMVQALKPAECGKGFILRIREINGEKRTAYFTFNWVISRIAKCDLLERIEEELGANSSEVWFETAPFEIHSFYLEV